MKLNITQKLVVGFLVVILFSAMVGTFSYVSLQQITEGLQLIIEDLDSAVSKENYVISGANELIKTATRHNILLSLFIMFSFIATLGGALFLVARFTGRFTASIISLSKKAELIGQGKLNERIKISNQDSKDEIGELARTFNRMASSLQDRQREIEKVNQELERRDRVLREANEKLQQLNAIKSDFLSTVSHELRTPLTVIKGYVSLMKSQRLGPINARQEKGLIAADERADHLNSLINDLLNLSRIESNKYEIRQQSLDFTELAEETTNSMKPLFQKKKIHFKSRIPAELPKLYADKQKISQVLSNLLSNAIKFTPTGGEIILEALLDNEEKIGKGIPPNDFIQINVKDNGIGLAEKEIKKIFNKFYQADNTATREYGGTGLGLCITKNIVELHHGQIWVKSPKGGGSIFSFTLPKSHEAMHSANKSQEVPEGPYIKHNEKDENNHKKTLKQKILVVEDDPEICDLIVTCISSENWNIFTAKDGIEALEKIFQDPIDLIVLDINLPRLNGFDLCQIVKINKKTKDIPVLILSASAQRSEIDQGFRMGADDYITHPFVPDEVVKRICTLIR